MREQINAANRKRRDLAAQKVFEYLQAHPCVDCGEHDPVVLEFDHVRGEKKQDIAMMINNGASWERLLTEIEKCDVRCANDHRRRTASQHWLHSPRVSRV